MAKKGKSKWSWGNWDDWGGNWFGNSSYKSAKRKEIVKPYLNWYDQRQINKGIYEDQQFKQEMASKSLNGAVDKEYKKVITEDLIHDIYSIYYNKSQNITFEELKDSNKLKFKILEKVNNSLLKVVSNGNSIASYMYSKEICHFLFQEFISGLSKEELEQLKDELDKSNQGESESEKNDKKQKGQKGKGQGQGDSDEEDDEEGEGSGEGEGDGEEGDNQEDGNGSGGNDADEEGEEGDEGESDNLNERKGSNKEGKGKKGSAGKGNQDRKSNTGHNIKENPKETAKEAHDRREQKKQQKQQNKSNEQTQADRLSETLDNMFKKQDVQKRFDEAILKADKMMIDLEKAGIQLDEKKGIDAISQIANIHGIRDMVKGLAVNKSAIAEAIKTILDNSINYFSKKYSIKEVDFFEADEIGEIYGLEFIHPVFRNMMLDRLSTEERKYLGKIDLYIDISGSMSSNSGIPGVSNLLFAKAIALTMLNMDLLNNLYVFDNTVRQIPATELGILTISSGGGTVINNVIKHVGSTGRNNAICLTDGEDRVNCYDERCFFLGTVGVMFRYFMSDEQGKKFIINNQCINFDGHKVTKITEKLLGVDTNSRGW